MNRFESFYSGVGSPCGGYDGIKVSLASASKIRSMSHGEVTKPETINYRTLKPENSGLFCAKIFGPVKNYECLCGKYKKIRYIGVVCEKCGVEVAHSRARRERMGHIELASPVAHIWFLKSLPSKICTLLDITLRNAEKVLYFESYIVTDPGISDFGYKDVITEDEYSNAIKEYGRDSFTAMMGAEAIRHLLSAIELEPLAKELLSQSQSTNSEIKRKKFIKRLRLVEQFLSSGNNPADMVLDVIPVIPSDLRPLVMLEGGRFATSDLNSLYRSVVNRNNRLRSLITLKAPPIIINNEKRMLQEACDALFDNSRRTKVIKGSNRRPYKSLSDMLKGKQGRFRQNLLGKRVDYSGRSVIVVGPTLKLHQCGLPRQIALELFKPFIYRRLEVSGCVSTVKAAKRMVQNEQPEVWDALAKVIHQHPVFLNRAPTLHRLSVQAFEPILIDGKAIQLHPLVCTAFNADFDGDQMSVHVPLSVEAQIEARVLVMSTNNILNPANSKPTIVPSKDIVLGMHYLTLQDKSNEDIKKSDADIGINVPLFRDLDEVDVALELGHVTLHQKVMCRVSALDKESGDNNSKIITTTPGRAKLIQILPKGFPAEVANCVLDVKSLTDLVDSVCKQCGQAETVKFADALMELGFRYATLSGTSFGKDDMIVPQSKQSHIDSASKQVESFEFQYREGLLTEKEKRNKVIDAWQKCTDSVAKDMMDVISAHKNVKEINSIYMMAKSGARGSPAQIKQLAGMRGLMSKPSGEIIENPIKSNLLEGQSVLEYFNSTHGARKGLADTALKTANSGYLTRRLVDVAQDTIVSCHDCGTSDGLVVRAVVEGGVVTSSIGESIFSRASAVDILSPLDGSVIIKRDQIFDDAAVDKIESLGIDSIKIRSVLTCKAKDGVCALCYGLDPARRKPVSLGEAVGVIAAQSVGEPGTQLTMRTFHVGGAATRRVESSHLNAFCSGEVRFENAKLINNKEDKTIVISRAFEVVLVDSMGLEHSQGRVPYGGVLYVKEGQKVHAGAKLAEWDPYMIPIISEFSGKAVYADLLESYSYSEVVDESTGISNRTVVDWRQDENSSGLRPRIEIKNEGELLSDASGKSSVYLLPFGSVINIANGEDVSCGDVIAKIAKDSVVTRDITGGLPRVIELFEARRSKVSATISEIDGYVEFAKDYYKSKRKIIVRSAEDSDQACEYLIPKGRHIVLNEGDFIKKGEPLMDGDPDLHEILRVLGLEALADYMIGEIQRVYRLQGVKINNKHIEIIMRKMLQRVEITDPGSTSFLVGESIDVNTVLRINGKMLEQSLKPASYNLVLHGITRASLQKSFIAAASFQETTRVLTDAAVAGKIDKLKGLKENIIVGRLLPIGAGFFINKKSSEMLNGIDQSDDIDNEGEVPPAA